MTVPLEIISSPVTREELIEVLANTEHACWMRHRKEDKGIDTGPEGQATTEHDRDRARKNVEMIEFLASLGCLTFSFLPPSDLPNN